MFSTLPEMSNEINHSSIIFNISYLILNYNSTIISKELKNRKNLDTMKNTNLFYIFYIFKNNF